MNRQFSAAAGLQVVLVDRDQETADKGKAALHKAMSDRVMKGRMKGADRDSLLGKITPSADYAALKDCDLIIEAVFEKVLACQLGAVSRLLSHVYRVK